MLSITNVTLSNLMVTNAPGSPIHHRILYIKSFCLEMKW